ncbi:LPD38 domain-containing protein [Halomonas sp. LS-001]
MSFIDDLRQRNPNLNRFTDRQIADRLRQRPEFANLQPTEFEAQVFGQPAGQSQPDEEPGFMAGLSAGIDQVQAMGGGLVMAAGEALESESLLNTGRDVYQRNMDEAGENSLGYGFTDIRDAGEAWQWAKFTAGNMLPMLATSAAGGGVGGVAAGAVAGTVAKQAAIKAGQVLGAATASTGMETGALMGETGDLDVSLAHGVVAGSLDTLTPLRMLRSMGKGDLADKAADEISSRALRDLRAQAERSGMRSAARGSLTNMLSEATTEGLQGLIHQHASYWVENNGETLLANLGEVNLKQLADEAAAGGLMGGIIGAPVGLAERRQARQTQASIEQNTAARTAEAREQAAAAGEDSLGQAQAAQQAEQEAESEQQASNRQRQQEQGSQLSTDLYQRLNRSMGVLDVLESRQGDLQGMSRTKLNSVRDKVRRADRAFEQQRYQEAGNLLNLAESGLQELDSEVQYLAGRQRQEASKQEPQQREPETPLLPHYGTIYGEGPTAGNANTGLDQPFDRARFTDTGARSAVDSQRAQQQAQAERAAQAARSRGKSETTYLPDNTPIKTRFRVMEASALTPSNTPDGRVNPRYPQELQPRDRTNANSQVQVRNIASRLNPERLGSSTDASTGAPIIGNDGVVESGNGRTMAISAAYNQNSPQSQRYREYIRAEAERQGIDPSAVDNMQQPVLVRERTTNVDRADFARRANESSVAGMTAYEQAQADADSLTAQDIQAWAPDESGDPLAASNRNFQRNFVRSLGNNEASRYTTRDGQATPELGQRMQRAIFAAAYQDPDMVEMTTEQSDNMRNLTAGLQAAAADLAAARETGSRDALDAIDTIADAVRLVRQSRRDDMSVRELVRQQDAFSDPVPESTAELALGLNNSMRSRQGMTDALTKVARNIRTRAENENNGALFEDTTTNEDVFNAGFQGQAAEQGQDQVQGQRPPETDVSAGVPRSQSGATGRPQDESTQGAALTGEAPAVDSEPLLNTYTEQDLAERDLQQQEADAAEQTSMREQEQRAQADAEVDDFNLSGSNSTTDIAASRGQNDLLGVQPDTAPMKNVESVQNDAESQPAISTPDAAQLDADDALESAQAGPAQTEPALEPVIQRRANGDAFGSERSAMASKYARDAKKEGRRVKAVPVEGGYAVQIEDSTKGKDGEQASKMGSGDTGKGYGNLGATHDGPTPTRSTVGAEPSTNIDQAEGGEQSAKQPIQDFGEKIEGARKDQVNKVLDGLKEKADNTSTLSEAFPAPNYTKLIEEGVDPRSAAMVAVLRQSIPAKPRNAYKLRQWVSALQSAQSLAEQLLDGSRSFDAMLEKVSAKEYRQLEGTLRTAELIAPIKPSLLTKAAKWKVEAKSGFSLYNGEKFDLNTTVYELRDERGRRTGIWATDFEQLREKAANTITRAVEDDGSKPKSKYTKVNVYRNTRTGDRFIAFKASSRVIRLKGGFESVAEASTYIDENQDAIQQQIDALRAGPRMRGETNAPREGMDQREGDISPDDFQAAFGFRGVQFGNYVEDKRRQDDLNRAYDALMDLAMSLGVPPKAMSLDGTLGLAFGARGRGGKRPAAAHYEPGQVVINLTKKSGAGSLAHEWFHALDNFIPHGQGTQKFQTDLTSEGPARAELAERWREMRAALKDSGFKKRSDGFDEARSKPYYGTPVELAARSFERYTRERLDEQGVRNDYLVNIVLGEESPYPTDQEMDVIRPAFDRLLGTLEHRETERGVQLYSANVGSESTRPAPRAEDIKQALEGVRELGDVAVVQSTRDLPPEVQLRMALDGVSPGDVRGLYARDKLYVVANNVDSVQEGIRTAVHEAVGHKGIRGVLGDSLDTTMLALYRSLPNSKEGRAALKEVLDNYPFLDPQKREDRITIGEEMVAHLLEKGHRPKAWQRAVAKIRDALRRLFPSVGWTYTDVLAMGEQSREYLRREQDRRVAEKAATTMARYSQRSGENTLFTPIKQEAEAYRSELSRQVIRERMPRKRFSLGRTPPVLAALGAPDLPLSVDSGVIYKATQGKHSVSMEVVKQLPELLHDPIMVMDSATQESALVVMVQGVDQQGRPVLVPLHLNKREARLEVNRVASAYGRHNPQAFIEREFVEGRVRYLQTQKSPEWLQSIRLQLPGEGVSQGPYSSLLTPDDIGNLDADIRYSLRGNHRSAFENQFSDFTDADRAAAAKIGSRTPPQQAMQWFKEHADRAGTKIRQGMVDRFAALKEMDEAIYGESTLGENIQRSSWVLARMSNAANGALHALLHNGRIKLDAQEKVINLQDGDAKGLGEVLGRLGSAAEIERFMGWIAGNRAAKLAEEGRENLFDAENVGAMKRWNRGQMEDGRRREQVYQEVFNEFQQYRDDVLAVAEQSGIISGEQRDLWRDDFYVPFYRLSEDKGAPSGQLGTAGLSRQQAYKRLKGGTQNLNDLLQNTMMNFHHLLDASLKNQAAVQAVENAKQLGMAERVPESNRDTKKSTFVMENGKKVFYEIDDPLVFQALTALAHPGMNSTAMKVMRGFKRVFTNMTTTTPQFIIANLIRDSLQATATNDVSKNVFKNVVEGGRSWKDQRIRAQMMASGAAFNFGHLYGTNPDELRAQLTRNMRGADLVDGPHMVPKVLAKAWSGWNDINNAAENVNRAAIYTQNREGGELRAAFESRDLIDFSAHGAWPAVRILIDIVPFLNARIQGLDKIYRSGIKPGASVLRELFGGNRANVTDKQAAGRFWAVTGALTMATIALYLHNHDDEEYDKLEDWQKDTYWFFRVGENAMFIPKPFEVGAIATLAERVTQQFVDDKATGKVFAQRLMHMMTDTFSFSPVPQAVQPALDIYANYDAFTGRPIESMGMDRLSPELRRRHNTSKAGEWISAGLNKTLGAIGHPDKNPLALSPVQVDHLIGGYFGQVGTWVAGSGDIAWRLATGVEAPERRWHEYQPVRRFYRDLSGEGGYTKYGTLFYEGLREASRAQADVKELREMGRLADAMELTRDKQALLALRTPLNRAQRRLSTINKRIDLVRKSSMSGELKRQRIERLQAIKNQIQRALGERVLEARVAG